jgi:hypothetical protein
LALAVQPEPGFQKTVFRFLSLLLLEHLEKFVDSLQVRRGACAALDLFVERTQLILKRPGKNNHGGGQEHHDTGQKQKAF